MFCPFLTRLSKLLFICVSQKLNDLMCFCRLLNLFMFGSNLALNSEFYVISQNLCGSCSTISYSSPNKTAKRYVNGNAWTQFSFNRPIWFRTIFSWTLFWRPEEQISVRLLCWKYLSQQGLQLDLFLPLPCGRRYILWLRPPIYVFVEGTCSEMFQTVQRERHQSNAAHWRHVWEPVLRQVTERSRGWTGQMVTDGLIQPHTLQQQSHQQGCMASQEKWLLISALRRHSSFPQRSLVQFPQGLGLGGETEGITHSHR